MGQVCGSEECEGTVEDMQSTIDTLTKENKALNTEKVGMIASLDAMGAEIERLREEEVSWVSCGVQNAAKVLKVESENTALTEKVAGLKSLCDEYFLSYMIQPYAGARRECLYCGATDPRDGAPHHSASDCPIIKYQALAEKE